MHVGGVAPVQSCCATHLVPLTVASLSSPEHCLLFLLVDEVESLTAARSAAASGSEPSDASAWPLSLATPPSPCHLDSPSLPCAVRVVNAVLTAIDALRVRK